MPTSTSLPGFDRLIAICQQHSLPCELYPPLTSAAELKEFIPGEPLDPQLAAMYQRIGGAELGPLSIYGPSLEWDGLVPHTMRLRQDGFTPFLASLIFAKETGFSFFFATVPRLAGSQGLQPIVYIEFMDSLTTAPVASSVDRFFDSYSRYLELMVVDPGYIYSKVSEVSFPWGVPQLIARDEPLLEQVRAGRFDFLTEDDESGRRWTQRLVAAHVE
ncbi:MAG TPA: hypothetical protein VF815_27085, partial [Myxococcaceae bacterium]|jgi:hypothetical protein